MRSAGERVADVRRWLAAARQVYAARASLAVDLVASTGLSAAGVELGFASLEREASDEELRRLAERAGDAAHVHVVLSANVFVAALRAVAFARAAAARVTVRPSPRDPVLARALVEAAGDDAVTLAGERDAATLEADVVHVYGRDETVAAVRARAPSSARVVGHGAGLGVALVTADARAEGAADALALDVVAFDQRGCLSPRVAIVLGSARRAAEIADALDASLARLAATVPRGALLPEERAEAARWRDVMAFGGTLRQAEGHAVAVGPAAGPLLVPPPGRHVLVVAAGDLATAAARLSPIARFVVAVGGDDPARAAGLVPGARAALLGRMQRPPLDGPVDLREAPAVT